MDGTKITPEILETSLRAMRKGKPPEAVLSTIRWADNPTGEGTDLHFERLVHELTWQSYSNLRQVEGLTSVWPRNRQEAVRQLAEDFRTRNGDLAAWSALYYRYIVGIDVSVKEMAQAASIVPQQLRRRLNQGLALLAKKLVQTALEEEKTPVSSPPDLPLPEFTALVGVHRYFELLAQLFNAPDGPRLVSLEGIGGIGKSALARAFISRPKTTAHWRKIAWVSARQAMLAEDGQLSPLSDSVTTLEDVTARLCDQLGLTGMAARPLTQRLEGLKTVLNQEKYLIVVDNLETVEEYSRLVPALGNMAGESRFLITTRQTLREFAYVHTVALRELDKDCAFDLIKAEIIRRGREDLISVEQFADLYTVIGGLPLAIKLVAAQLFLRPLSDILKDFRQAKVSTESLYRYLYWQTWHSLGDPARRLLLSFLLSDPEGEDLEFLRLMSGQSDEEYYAALKELDRFSLLEVNGDAELPLYRLHRLATTFLQTDILNLWAGSEHD